MVLFNYTTREITAKIVYYGPGLGGKTTNLQSIFEGLPADKKGKMLSLATKSDRTLFFDFLPLDLGTLGGMRVRIQLYTVPGQVYYNSTRKLVLKGTDGVVFVADSQSAMEEANRESFQNLRDNLTEQGVDLEQISLVLQYNKRDLPALLPVDKLLGMLNRTGWTALAAVASRGIGVQETLREILRLVFLSLCKRYDLTLEEGSFLAALEAQRDAATAAAETAGGEGTPGGREEPVLPLRGGPEEAGGEDRVPAELGGSNGAEFGGRGVVDFESPRQEKPSLPVEAEKDEAAWELDADDLDAADLELLEFDEDFLAEEIQGELQAADEGRDEDYLIIEEEEEGGEKVSTPRALTEERRRHRPMAVPEGRTGAGGEKDEPVTAGPSGLTIEFQHGKPLAAGQQLSIPLRLVVGSDGTRREMRLTLTLDLEEVEGAFLEDSATSRDRARRGPGTDLHPSPGLAEMTIGARQAVSAGPPPAGEGPLDAGESGAANKPWG